MFTVYLILFQAYLIHSFLMRIMQLLNCRYEAEQTPFLTSSTFKNSLREVLEIKPQQGRLPQLLIPEANSPLKGRAANLTEGLMSTCPQIGVNDIQSIQEENLVSTLSSPTTADFLDELLLQIIRYPNSLKSWVSTNPIYQGLNEYIFFTQLSSNYILLHVV